MLRKDQTLPHPHLPFTVSWHTAQRGRMEWLPGATKIWAWEGLQCLPQTTAWHNNPLYVRPGTDVQEIRRIWVGLGWDSREDPQRSIWIRDGPDRTDIPQHLSAWKVNHQDKTVATTSVLHKPHRTPLNVRLRISRD